MTSMLKLEITVFFWLSLPVHSGSLKKIDYPKQICLAHPLSFERFRCSERNTSLYFYLIDHAVSEGKIFENNGHVHVYSPRAGADNPLGSKSFQKH